MEGKREFLIARSLVDLSEVENPDDTYRVAEARALYIVTQVQREEEIQPYKGRNPDVVNLVSESIAMQLMSGGRNG